MSEALEAIKILGVLMCGATLTAAFIFLVAGLVVKTVDALLEGESER